MISKKELLTLLADGIKREDEILPLYARHLEHTVEYSGFDELTQNRITNAMEVLIKESAARKGTFNAISALVEASDRDIF